MSAEVRARDFPFAERRTQITAEARGKLRIFWRRLEAEAALIVKAVEAVPPAMAAAAVRPGVGATAAQNRVIARLPIPPLAMAKRRCVWRFLRPSEESGPLAIEVRAVLLGGTGRPPLATEAFGLKISRHALGRLIDQDPKADPREAMLESHDHLAALPTACGEQVFDLQDIVLPAGAGAFLAAPSRDHQGRPMLIAKTWVCVDRFTARQAGDFLAWGRFAAASVSA